MSDGIVLQNITKKFGTAVAVNDVDLTIERGKLTVILGPSGCGKTTILRMIAGLETPTVGRIEIDGQTVARDGYSVEPDRRGIGIVFQSYALWPHMTVRGNIGFPLKMRGIHGAEQADRIRKIVELVRMEAFLERHPTQLSGGQQQRVALARALVPDPSILLLDEPLANLDAKLREIMRKEIKRIQRETGTTTAHVTHDQAEALALADRVVVMNHGVIMGLGDPREIYQRPPNLYCARFLGELNEIATTISDIRGGDAAVRIADQEVLVPCPGCAAGDAVIAAIRPVDTRVERQTEPSSGSILESVVLDGQVTESTFMGMQQQLTVDTPCGPLLAYTRPQSVFEVGEPVRVVLPQEDLLAFSADEEADAIMDGPA